MSSSGAAVAAAAATEQAYRLLRQHHSSPGKLSLALSSAGISLSAPGLLESVIARCGPAVALALAAHSLSPQPPSHLANRLLLRSLSRSRLHAPLALAYARRIAEQCPALAGPDLFLPLLRRYAASGLLANALSLLDEMPQPAPSARFFECIVDAMCKKGRLPEAEKLFEEMRGRFAPSIYTFTSLLHGWCRLGKLDEAKHVLVRMKQCDLHPDVVVYNVLLAGLVAAARFEDGFELMKEMERKGCPPNAVSYTTLIGGLSAKGRMDEVMRVYADMGRNGCRPDAVTFATVINGFCKAGKVDQGFRFLDEMVRKEMQPDAGVYSAFFAAYERKDRLEECLELMERMRKDGCRPDIAAYNVVIRLACKLGEREQAVALWNEMENGGLSPGVDTFVIMVSGMVKARSLVEACGYLREMAARGLFVTPHYGIMKDLFNSLLRDGKLELAKEAWGCIAGRGCEMNACGWTIWIHALFSRKHVKEACEYCLAMLDAGQMPQPDTFAKLMKGLKKLYNKLLAAEITEKVRKMAAERGVSFKMYKRRGVRLLEDKRPRRKGEQFWAYKKKKGRRGRRGATLSDDDDNNNDDDDDQDGDDDDEWLQRC